MVKNYHRLKNITIRELPYDVFYDILLRLPVRSLICCLCVSKQWHSFIKSPRFASMHLKHTTQGGPQNHHKLLVITRNLPCTFSIFDCETLEAAGPCRPVPFKVTYGHIRIKSSCNGLVLVTLKKDFFDTMLSDIILWNPLTGDYKKPKTKPKYYKEFYNDKGIIDMYYNSFEEDYRFLRITHLGNAYIYSLKSDTWRRIMFKDTFRGLPYLISMPWLKATCWNQNLYFKVFYNRSLRFDTKTEEFTEIATPFIEKEQHSDITVQRGCMYSCVRYSILRDPSHKEYIELLKMKEDGDWEKVSTYPLEAYLHPSLKPFHLMRDGNWLMKDDCNSHKIYRVDLENKHNGGRPRLYVLNGQPEGKYIETFVSPNIYMN